MADKKKGNAFTNNPLVKAVGTQKIVVLLVIIVLFAFFSIMSPGFRKYPTLVSIFDYSYYISFMAHRRYLLSDHRRCGSVHWYRNDLLRTVRRLSHYPSGHAGARRYPGNDSHGCYHGLHQRCAGGVLELPPFIATLGNHDGSQRFRFLINAV